MSYKFWWAEFHAFIQKPKVIAPKCEVRETERRVMKLVFVRQVFNFQIPKPCEDLSQIFPNGITTFFRITMRVPCTCLFSRTCSNSLLTSWFDIICIEAIVCYNPEPFQATLYILLSFASQIWAVKKIIIPFVSVTNHDISL